MEYCLSNLRGKFDDILMFCVDAWVFHLLCQFVIAEREVGLVIVTEIVIETETRIGETVTRTETGIEKERENNRATNGHGGQCYVLKHQSIINASGHVTNLLFIMQNAYLFSLSTTAYKCVGIRFSNDYKYLYSFSQICAF